MRKTVFRCFIFFLSMSLSGVHIYAQSESDTNAIYEDYSYLTASVSYITNSVDSKSSYQTKATIADISYYHKSGFFAGLMPSFYNSIKDLDATLGYTKYFNSGFDITASYLYHTTSSSDSINSGIQYNHSTRFSLGYFAENLYAYVDGYSLHGTSHNYYLEPGLALYFDIEGIFTENDYISIFPMISATFGTDYYIFDEVSFYEYYWLKKTINNAGYETQKFGYQSIDFTIPVSYSIGDLSLSATFMYSSPGQKYRTYGWVNQAGLLFSVLYMIDF